MADELIGKQIGGYEIIAVAGQGGMATVYRAQQVSMNRTVAIKVLPRHFVNDDTYLHRFNREVRIVAQLEHRNIVPVYDYGEFEGQPYIVMRYMNAGSIEDLLMAGALGMDTILNILMQIAPALDYAHSKNVLHRDLKPSNVLIDDDGGAYLTDFGIARITGDQNMTNITTQGVVGTPSYMSPEQAQGQQLDHRSDIYALGVMLFEMATGRRPFESDTPYSVAVMQVTTPPPSPRSYNAKIPLSVEEVIYKALKKKREERYASATALAEAFKRALESPVVHDTQPRGIRRQQAKPAPAPVVPPPPPMVQANPPQVYAHPSPPSSVASPAYTPPEPSANSSYIRRLKKRSNSGGLWMSAAIGALIGCAILTILVIVATIVISGMQTNASPRVPENNADSESRDQVVVDPNAPPTLDPTSEAAREALLRSEIDATQTFAPSLATPTNLPISSNGAITGASQSLNLSVGEQPTLVYNAVASQVTNSLIFFAQRSDNYDIFRLDLDTRQETQLTTDGGTDSYPTVSPDGTRIAFQSDRDGDFDIYVMDMGGGNVRKLTENDVWDRIPSWSADGAWIVFSSDTRGDGNYDLFQIRPDGSDGRLLLTNGMRNSHPRWSIDSRFLVFTTGVGDDATTWEIGRMELPSEEVIALTDGSRRSWSPSFSPDGQQVLYLTDGQGNAAIARMNVDGSNQQVIYDDSGYEWGLSYSPDGRYISFTSSITGEDELYLMTADATDVQQLTTNGGMYASWVP
jgi:serine/threonine protein kinase